MKKQEKTEFDVSLETKSESEKEKLLRRKRIIAIVSIVIAVALFIWLGFYLTDVILSSIGEDGDIMNTAQNFKELIESYGKWGVIVAFG
ncbi:MAG: hypothetical protein IJC20_01685, partial [Clostridia bacterium]|nr:hypothetical protein [Clostridia bacterium]